MSRTNWIQFPHQLALRPALDGEWFLGIGEVRCGDVPLRDSRLPWTIYAEADNGFRFDEFRLRHIRESSERVAFVLEARGRWLPRAQETDAMGDSRVRTRRCEPPVATVLWHFRPISERLHDNDWVGLATQVEFHCLGHPIHWLIEDTTWELGGRATGVTVVSQDITSGPLEQTIRAGDAFTTAEQFKFKGAPITPMDMLCRGAGACVCDFQARDQFAMCLFSEPPGIERARMEKFADEDVIHYTNRAFFPLGDRVTLPERKLLVYRQGGSLARHEWRNLWLDCFTDVRARYHRAYDFQLETPQPMIHCHLWNPDLEALGARWTEPLVAALPEFARLGYREFYPHFPWTGTSDDPQFQFDRNICANYDFIFSEKFGGVAGMKQLCDAARRHGMDVVQWVGFEFHSWSPLWKEHPDWVLRQANGAPWDAGYRGPYWSLWCGRMRSGFRQHLYERLKAAYATTGLGTYFWDSYGNLGQTGIDYGAPDKAPQGEDVWRFQADLQKLGVRQRCEMVTIFGVSTVGMLGFDPQGFTKRQWSDVVAHDQAFTLLDTAPAFFGADGGAGPNSMHQPGRLDDRAYFWLAAHRCLPPIPARPWSVDAAGKPLPGGGAILPPGGRYAEAFGRVNRLYQRVSPRMHRLRLLAGGRAVEWHDTAGQPAVRWDFENQQVTQFDGWRWQPVEPSL